MLIKFNKRFFLISITILMTYSIAFTLFYYYFRNEFLKQEILIKDLLAKENIYPGLQENTITKSQIENSKTYDTIKQNAHYLELIYKNKNKRQTFLVFLSILYLFPFIVLGLVLFYLFVKFTRENVIFKDMVTNLTHELNNPLTSIKLASSLLYNQVETIDRQKVKQYTFIIQQEVSKLLQQTKHLLNTSINFEKDYKFRIRNYRLHGIINYTVNNFKKIYSEEDIIFELDFKATHDIVYLDRTHVINIFTNLIENARKYSKNKPVKIKIYTKNENKKIFFEITDNGIGIDDKHIKYIFKKFYRVTDNLSQNISGFGVGLYYAKTILNYMSADIRVKSKINEGTKFIIEFQKSKTYDNRKA